MSKPELPLPGRTPLKRFYYHYKHDSSGPINNYAYEVIGVAFHTEAGTDDPPKPGEEHFVIYRPLYESKVYQASKQFGVPCFDARPLEMWMEEVEKGGGLIPRFRLIINKATIRALEVIRNEMYPH